MQLVPLTSSTSVLSCTIVARLGPLQSGSWSKTTNQQGKSDTLKRSRKSELDQEELKEEMDGLLKKRRNI